MRGSGAEPPAAEGKGGFEGGSPDAETIFTVFFILWSKFLLKNKTRLK